MAKSFLESLFGKKKRTVSRSKTTRKTKVSKPSKALRTQAKKYGVKTTLKRGTKRVYKSESVLKKQVKAAMKTHKKKMSRKVKRRTRSKKSSFGIGGRYVPLASIMSPYPRSVNSGAPWL